MKTRTNLISLEDLDPASRKVAAAIGFDVPMMVNYLNEETLRNRSEAQGAASDEAVEAEDSQKGNDDTSKGNDADEAPVEPASAPLRPPFKANLDDPVAGHFRGWIGKVMQSIDKQRREKTQKRLRGDSIVVEIAARVAARLNGEIQALTLRVQAAIDQILKQADALRENQNNIQMERKAIAVALMMLVERCSSYESLIEHLYDRIKDLEGATGHTQQAPPEIQAIPPLRGITVRQLFELAKDRCDETEGEVADTLSVEHPFSHHAFKNTVEKMFDEAESGVNVPVEEAPTESSDTLQQSEPSD